MTAGAVSRPPPRCTSGREPAAAFATGARIQQAAQAMYAATGDPR